MKATLRIDVIYDVEGHVPTSKEARKTLKYAAKKLVAEGLLGDADDVLVRVTTSEDKQKAIEMQLWREIDMYAGACGATNLRNRESLGSMCAIEDVLAEFRYIIETLKRRVKAKDDVLEDIGRVSFLFKNTAHGDALLIREDLGDKVEKGLTK